MSTEAAIANLLPPAGLLAGQTIDHLSASGWYTAGEVAQRVQLVQQIFRSIMQQDVHFGVIPGCDKPSLWKPGSEQLCMTFHLAVTPEVEDLSTPDCARYRVTCRFTHAPTGLYLGAGIGEASTNETKYKWRKARCVDEYESTDAGCRQIVWKNGQHGAYSEMQVRANPADVANTALKMAKKRAQIDGTLTITAASDIFTQDIEDLELAGEPGIGAISDTEPAAPPKPQPVVQMPQRRAPQPPPNQPKPEPQPTPPLQPRSYAGPAKLTPLQESTARAQSQPAQRTQPARLLPQGEKISDGQDKRFFAIAMGNGITKPEIRAYLEQTWGISNSRDLVKGACYEQAVAWAEGK